MVKIMTRRQFILTGSMVSGGAIGSFAPGSGFVFPQNAEAIKPDSGSLFFDLLGVISG